MTYGSIQESRSDFMGSEPWVTNLAVLNEMTVLQSAAKAGLVGRLGNPALGQGFLLFWYFCSGEPATADQYFRERS